MAYPFSKWIFWPLFRLFIRRIDGLENIPSKPCILVANHSSYIDGPLLIMLMAWHRNRSVHVFATNERFLSGFWNALFQHFGAIRVNGSLNKGLAALKKEDSLLLFPEGSRTPDGLVHAVAHHGLGVLALKANVPVIPIYLNTFWWWNVYRTFPRCAKDIVVTIGKPLSFALKPTKRNYSIVVKKTMDAIKQLARY